MGEGERARGREGEREIGRGGREGEEGERGKKQNKSERERERETTRERERYSERKRERGERERGVSLRRLCGYQAGDVGGLLDRLARGEFTWV
jgi:hypothetical protein